MKRAKYMDLKMNFVKHIVESGQTAVINVNFSENEADGFTKSLNAQNFEDFRNVSWVNSLHWPRPGADLVLRNEIICSQNI